MRVRNRRATRNSGTLAFKYESTSTSRSIAPVRNACRRLESGHVPVSLNGSGQRRSMYPAPGDSFSNDCALSAASTRPQRVSDALAWPAPRSISLMPSAAVLSARTTKRYDAQISSRASLVLLAHGIEPTRTRARGRVNRDQLAEIDLHWHDLRHEAACRWLTSGLDLRAIQLLLGHADLKTTQRYLNVTDEELRKTMQEKLWKRR